MQIETEKQIAAVAQKESYTLSEAALQEIRAGSDSAKTDRFIESQLANFKLQNNGFAI